MRGERHDGRLPRSNSLARFMAVRQRKVRNLMEDNIPAGWAFPGAARKAHYFEADETTSTCGRWLYFDRHREPETGARSKDDCAACVRKLPAPVALVCAADCDDAFPATVNPDCPTHGYL